MSKNEFNLNASRNEPSRQRNITYLKRYAKFLVWAGSLNDAAKNYEQALALDQDNLTILSRLGSLYREKRNDQAAFHYLWRAYDLSIERHPQKQADPEIALRLGRLHLSRQEYELAQEKFRYVVEARPDNVEAQAELRNLEMQIAQKESGNSSGLIKTLSYRSYEI